MDVSMLFGIIFTCIVIGVILIFGGEQIANFFLLGSQAQVLKTMDSLQKKVDSIYRLAEGSGSEFALSFPKDYKVCFFNSSNPAPRFYADMARTWDPDSITKYRINSSHYNTWYFSGNDNAAGDGKRIPYLDIPTSKNFCIPGGGKVYVVKRFDSVEIEPT
jgi:hypothetical protein